MLSATIAQAGPTVTVGKQVASNRLIPVESIDHAAWDALLSKYVDDRGQVDYKAWKAAKSDVRLLDEYLNQLSAASISRKSSKQARLAFWINAYNAVTVKGILREYPTTSIRNHTARIWGYNIWDDLQLQVASKPYSLNDIEHKLLRKMDEPRIHFAIVCASIGCPRLLNKAYVPEKIEEQLSLNAKDFFADRSKFRIDKADNTVYASPILDWFGEDFGKTSAEQLRTIAPYVPAADREFVSGGRAELEFLDYDWGLNKQD